MGYWFYIEGFHMNECQCTVIKSRTENVEKRCDLKEKEIKDLMAWKNKTEVEMEAFSKWKMEITKEVGKQHDWQNRAIPYISILVFIALKILDSIEVSF